MLPHLPALDPYKIVAQHIGQLHRLGVPQGASPQLAGKVGDAAAPAVFVGQQPTTSVIVMPSRVM